MVDVIINTCLYLFAFIIVYWYKKRFDEGCFVLLIYLITAICNYIYYVDNSVFYNNITLFPFIYLFIILILFFRPFLSKRIVIVDKLQAITSDSKQYKILLYLSIGYIIFTIISAYYSLNKFAENLAQEAWKEIYDDPEKYETPYINFLDGVAKRYTDYLRPLILLFSFYLISSYNKRNKLKPFLLLFSVVFSTMIAAVAVASRGNIVNILIMITLCYIIFKDKISKKLKKIIFIIAGIISSFLLIYIISVTVSRFGENDTASNSVLYYLGHSMLSFNDGLFNTITKHSQGTYFFSYFIKLLGLTPVSAVGGIKATGAFYTFVGSLYLDFPPFILFLIALIFPFIITLFCHLRSKQIDFADIYLYFFYLYMLAKGFTVGGPSEGFLWFIAILIYCGLKFSFRLKFK